MEVFYDLGKSPTTHDFCNWLVRAEQERIKSGAETLRIRIVRGRRYMSDRDYQYSTERRNRRVYELLMPLCRLLPSVVDVCMVDEGEQTLSYLNFPEPQAPVFKAQEIDRAIVAHYLNGAVPVTFTVRQSDFEADRNTRNSEWLKVMKWVKSQGFEPVVIPDMEADMTGKKTGLEHHFRHYNAASYIPGIRLALYELSVLNLMTTGGPMVLALFADVPLAAFKLIVPGIQCCQPQHMINSAMTPDSNWGPRKRLYWADDTAANVLKYVDMAHYQALAPAQEITDLFSLAQP